jgi:uncharacterized protein
MDKSDAIKISQQYAAIIKTKYDYSKMILFGSFAKGTNNADSDIDIAVVFKDYDDGIDMQLELMRLRRKLDSRIEPHPFKEKDFTIANPIVNEIMKYGQLI